MAKTDKVIIDHMLFGGTIGGDYIEYAFSPATFLKYDKIHPVAVMGVEDADIIVTSALSKEWINGTYYWIKQPPKLCKRWYHKLLFEHRKFFFEYAYNGKCFMVTRYHRLLKPYVFDALGRLTYQDDTLSLKESYPYFKKNNFFGPVFDNSDGTKIFIKESPTKSVFKANYRHLIVGIDSNNKVIESITTLYKDDGIYVYIDRGDEKIDQKVIDYKEFSSFKNVVIKGLTVIDTGARKIFDLYNGIGGEYNPKTLKFEKFKIDVPEYLL